MKENTMFGTYRLEEKLGEGGMGVVYRALDTQLDRTVAIKTLLSSTLGDAEVLERFVREAKAASRLQHPAIVTIYHVGVQDTTRYIVMEYVEGKTLKKAISGKPMSINQICSLGIQLADALALAHEKNVVHRDLKAENVMLTPRMQAKILDFGLAKLREPEAAGANVTVLTQVGIVMGTVSHMSPEQALGMEVDGRSDIFSLGVVFYEMATGKMPFDGPTAQATMARVLNMDPTPVAELNRDLPPEFLSLVQDCLRKDRNQRPTAVVVLARLKKIEASLSANRLASPEIRREMPVAPAPAIAMPPGSGSQTPVSGAPRPGSGGVARPGRIGSARSLAVAAPGPAGGLAKSGRVVAHVSPPPEELRNARLLFQGVRVFRITLSIALLALPFSFLAYFVIAGGAIRADVVEGTAFWTVVRSFVAPALGLANRVFSFSTKVGQWDFLALGFGILGFIVRHIILLWMHRGESYFKNRMVQLETATAVAAGIAAPDKASSHRMGMLREYAVAKKILSQEKRRLAFLSIDVVGSTKMKAGEDKLTIEHAFSEYKKFVERILKQNELWKVAWTPDGIMCAFPTTNDAVKAGQGVLNGLAWFNDGVHHLRTPFGVRCGVNAGEVVFPEEKNMEEISDETIDVAGHMQKYAAHGTLWIAQEICSEIEDATGFQTLQNNVDGFQVAEWRPAASPAGADKGASASAAN
jgi:tRNA A-37 threonylcarbamoyl transferase component Bud32/class 3 adenylate cyclase